MKAIQKQDKNKNQKTPQFARFFDAEAGGVEPHPTLIGPSAYQTASHAGGIQPPIPPQDELYGLLETKTTPLCRDAVFGPILSDAALFDKHL